MSRPLGGVWLRGQEGGGMEWGGDGRRDGGGDKEITMGRHL